MPQFSIDSFLLVRAPAYSYQNFNEFYLREVLKTDFFKAAIYFGSQALFLELRKKDFDYEQISPGAKITLWKYLNRMCFRALPYGLFSSFAASQWDEAASSPLCFEGPDQLIINPDFKLVTDHLSSVNLSGLPQLKFTVNNSMYRSSGQFRFISRNYSAGHKFAVVGLKIVPGLTKLLKFIDKGQRLDEIIQFLKNEYGEDVPASSYLQSLVDQQVIVSSLLPNLTGQKYHERCAPLFYSHPETARLLQTHYLEMQDQQQPLPALQGVIDNLIAQHRENPAYVLYQRQLHGALAPQVKTDLLQLVQDLDKLSVASVNPGLDQFKQRFIEKYDQQEVPLLRVLDPESGIGYENLASSFDPENESFIDDLKVERSAEEKLSWNAVTQMLFKKWNHLSAEGHSVIRLTDEDLALLPESTSNLPPGMALLFKLINQEIWLDSVGGVSGIEIMGRFAASGSAIESSLQAICAQQMAVNDEVAFAEIAFSTHDRAANINQRGHFYTYEIPLLNHSTMPDKQLIKLNELMVSVKNDMILLRSLRLNKYIIPRLSSAYNYRLNPIPILRFLGDLQFQGLKVNLSFSLKQLFPGLDYYPRVQLRNTVLSPATWILAEAQLKRIDKDGARVLRELGLTRYFCLVEGDNFLVFDQENASDVALFVNCIKRQQTATLTEYVATGQSPVRDQEGLLYAAQFAACAVNLAKSYQLPSLKKTAKAPGGVKVKRDFLPGEEWLYLKLYQHPSMTDELLISIVLPLVKQYKRNNPNFKWFYIRYQDPADHLRLRFLCTGNAAYQLLSAIRDKLKTWLKEGKVADLIVDTYRRELEKYSALLIDEVESFFYRDTELILAVLQKSSGRKTYKLSFAVVSALGLIRYFIPRQQERKDFISHALSNHSKEFKRDKELVNRLNLKYRKFQQELIDYSNNHLSQVDQHIFTAYEQSIQLMLSKMAGWETAGVYFLLTHLVHLHINRIFETTPREYEYVVYHFIEKHDNFLNHTTGLPPK